MSLSDDLKSAISKADVEQNLINSTPELRDFIHFDTLWQMASLIVLEHGHLAWTDTAEHDPGTTLLQAATYAIADLSYRHTHPLIDLLTPGQDAPVFNSDFGPEKVLTVSPATEDDYRRGILDLCDDAGNFLFRNAQLVRESGEESYKYIYDPVNGAFSFKKNAILTSSDQVLLGGYTLYVEIYAWQYRCTARAFLDAYLINHRNLGEQIRSIVDLSLEYHVLKPYIDVELDDDCQNPAQVMGRIWESVTKLYAPWPRRDVEEDLLGSARSTETLYEGPCLDNGWITQLPPHLNYTLEEPVDLRKLPVELLKIEGIKQVRYLSWYSDQQIWIGYKQAMKYMLFWDDSPHVKMTDKASTVRLFKRGQRQFLTADEVKPYMNWPKKTFHISAIGPKGKFLKSLGDPLTIAGLLPDCYGLNDDLNELDGTEKLQRQGLFDYLELFQKWITNGCSELAGLPQLLAFNQAEASKGSGYFQGYEKGLATIDYLLGYFGSQRAPRVFNKTDSSESNNDEVFFESQRAALAQWAELGYGRANVPVNTVTAFNKRLAFRLGIGADMFSAKPDLKNLPVYVIDYRTLLPEMPNVAFVDREVTQATLVTIDDKTNQLKLEFEDGPLPIAGQLISLRAVGITILWALVVRVDSKAVYLDLSNNPALSDKAEELINSDVAIVSNNSDIWLRRMTYPLIYAKQPKTAVPPSEYIYRLSVPYSVHLFNVNDVVKIDTSVIKSGKSAEGITAVVTEVNIPEGTLWVKAEAAWPQVNNQIFWYRVEDVISDRFSLKVGVVLDRDQWLKEEGRPEEVMAWVEQIVSEEMPAHIQADVHWLSEGEFDQFGINYKAWQQAAAESRLGETSYALLKQLSLGQLPAPGRGIGAYHIVTDEEMGSSDWYEEADEPPVSRWKDGAKEQVETAQVLYVPRDVSEKES